MSSHPASKRRRTSAAAFTAVSGGGSGGNSALSDATNRMKSEADQRKRKRTADEEEEEEEDLSGVSELIAGPAGDVNPRLDGASPALKLRKKTDRKRRARSGKLSAAPADGVNWFDALSDEMVLQVFRWLPRSVLAKCAAACHRFARLAGDEEFWGRVDLGHRSVPRGVVGLLMARGTQVLRLASATVVESQTVSVNFDCSRITHLDLSMAHFKGKRDLEYILSKCGRLQRLSLENVPLTASHLELVSRAEHLSSLNLAMCEGVTDAGMRAVLEGCYRLRDLNLAWTGLSSALLDDFYRLSAAEGLVRLNLSGCRETLGDAHVASIVVYCVNLTELDVSDCVNLTDNAVEHVAAARLDPGLQSFSASRCYKVMPATYLAFEDHPTMQYLNVFGVVKDLALVELKTRLPRLEINKFSFSSVARPTVGMKRTSVWGIRVRE